jgi:nicotinamidase/pyrazinamidase
MPMTGRFAGRDMQDEAAVGDALLLVDVQRDFLPGGALGVPKGARVVAPLNRSAKVFERRGSPIFASRDWHPPTHCSFKQQGGPWPPHCVADTPGAQFADDLRLPAVTRIVSKATTPVRDSYSAFGGTDLEAQLRALGAKRLFVGGLATDYCVLQTVLDARAAGFEVVVLRDAIAAVDVQPGDGELALARMKEAGATFAETAELQRLLPTQAAH